jgi:hypothetical protein
MCLHDRGPAGDRSYLHHTQVMEDAREKSAVCTADEKFFFTSNSTVIACDRNGPRTSCSLWSSDPGGIQIEVRMKIRSGLIGSALILMMFLTAQTARASVVYDFSFIPTSGLLTSGGTGELVLAGPVGSGQQDYAVGAAVLNFTVTIGGHLYDLTNSFGNVRFLNGSLVNLTVGQTPVPFSFAANGLQFTFFDQNANTSTVGSISAALHVAAVPELSTWAMMILGFAGLGVLTYRRRRQPVALVAA